MNEFAIEGMLHCIAFILMHFIKSMYSDLNTERKKQIQIENQTKNKQLIATN